MFRGVDGPPQLIVERCERNVVCVFCDGHAPINRQDVNHVTRLSRGASAGTREPGMCHKRNGLGSHNARLRGSKSDEVSF